MQPPTAEELESITRITAGLKEVVGLSATIAEWTLLLLGGTLAMLLSTSYHKPPPPFRKFYIVLLPAIALLVGTLVYSSFVHRAYAALTLRPATIGAARDALMEINSALDLQLKLFSGALGCLGVWLFGYAVWWIFLDKR